MKYRYNPDKNAKLIAERKIGFDEIIAEIANGNLLDITAHPNHTSYPHQKIMHVKCLDKVYLVPYVMEKDGTVFLKTLYPSRKATKNGINIFSYYLSRHETSLGRHFLSNPLWL